MHLAGTSAGWCYRILVFCLLTENQGKIVNENWGKILTETQGKILTRPYK